MKKSSLTLIVLLTILLINVNVYSQSYSLDNTTSQITVSGTSSLHDWDVISNNFNGTTLFNITTNQIENLVVDIASESLKSGKSIMDKKTYKALNSDDFKSITFKMIEVKSNSKINEVTDEVKIMGELTICGFKKLIAIDIKVLKTNKGVNVSGTYDMKMTDFKIEPPTALLGTIKTGDETSIHFNANFKNIKNL